MLSSIFTFKLISSYGYILDKTTYTYSDLNSVEIDGFTIVTYYCFLVKAVHF